MALEKDKSEQEDQEAEGYAAEEKKMISEPPKSGPHIDSLIEEARRQIALSNGNGNFNESEKSEDEEKILNIKPPAYIKEVKKLLKSRNNIIIDTPDLIDTMEPQREYRDTLFHGSFIQELYWMQNKGQLGDIATIEEWYRRTSQRDAYKCGKIDERILAIMHDIPIENLDNLVYRQNAIGTPPNPLVCVEMAAGNAEISRTLRDLRNNSSFIANLRSKEPNKSSNFSFKKLQEIIGDYLSKKTKKIDHDIIALDIAKGFVDKAVNARMRGVQADLCESPDDFMMRFVSKTGRLPNTCDSLYMNLAFDRLRDIMPTMEIMKGLAKMDSSTRFMFGQIFPLESATDSLSTEVPKITIFDEKIDPRKKWMNPDKAESVYEFIKDINYMGFRTERLAELPLLEVYSPHCPIALPEEFAAKYSHLRDFDFIDPELNKKRDRVFAGNILPEDITNGLVAFPNPYRLVLVAGTITAPVDYQKQLLKKLSEG